MRQKKRELIDLLLRYKGKFVTSAFLATELSLSDRTVRQYLNDLKEILFENGAEIISKQGYGFQINIQNHTAFNLFMANNQLSELSTAPIQFLDQTDRKYFKQIVVGR